MQSQMCYKARGSIAEACGAGAKACDKMPVPTKGLHLPKKVRSPWAWRGAGRGLVGRGGMDHSCEEYGGRGNGLCSILSPFPSLISQLRAAQNYAGYFAGASLSSPVVGAYPEIRE